MLKDEWLLVFSEDKTVIYNVDITQAREKRLRLTTRRFQTAALSPPPPEAREALATALT